MCWVVSLSLRPSTFRGDKMTKDDRGDSDLTKLIEIKDKELKSLNDVVVNLKNIIDSKEAEITAYQSKQTALYEEVKRLKLVDEEHQKLNGKLRLEINNLKEEAEEMYQYP
jgi:peptidoglycan hydrolase CwlO-like protein